MNAEIITIGTEILLGQITDTNSVFLAQRLAELGINVFYKTAVGDNLNRIVEALKTAALRADLLILTGGLGPTVDDLTREAVAEFCGKKLTFNPDIFQQIAERFNKRNMPMPPNNKSQAYLPENSILLTNHHGTAPGFILEKPVIIACVPGVPSEMKQMFENQIKPYLTVKLGLQRQVIFSKILKILGASESLVDEKIKDLFVSSQNPSIGILAYPDEIILRLTAKADSEEKALAAIDTLKQRIYQRLGSEIYGEDQETLEQIIAQLLLSQKLTIATAESCTSGLLAYLLTETPGSSAYYLGGINAYSNKVKTNQLNIDPQIIQKYGAVSAPCAQAMAENCAGLFQSDIAISITGIAGPGGGSPEKPVGLVYIGLYIKNQAHVQQYIFPGTRENIRKRAVKTALFTLYKELKG